MKNTSQLFVLFLLFLGCSNKYETVDNFISAENFIYAKKALSEIELSENSDEKFDKYKKIVDSGLYAQAYGFFNNKDVVQALKVIDYIENDSEYKLKKNNLIQEIVALDDSTYLKQATKLYNEKKYAKALEALDELSEGGTFEEEKKSLGELINTDYKKHRITNARKERKISKYVISSVFGRPPSIMKVTVLKDDEDVPTGIYEVAYFTDGRRYVNEVKFEDKKAVWRAQYGRWRTEDNLSYEETSNSYYIVEIYSDGSKRKDRFSK